MRVGTGKVGLLGEGEGKVKGERGERGGEEGRGTEVVVV